MGQGFGLEYALWFADGPEDAHEKPTFQRNRLHAYVAREFVAVRNALGCIEIANFVRHDFKGVHAFLDRLLASHMPNAGRVTLTPMLTPKGRICGDLTVACLGEDHFMLFGSGAMQDAHRRWFEAGLPPDVSYRNVSDHWHGIAISGPKSRDLLARITRDDVGNAVLKFRDTCQTYVGGGPVMLVRISFSGELGYEIYCKPPYLLRLAEAVEVAGADLGHRWYGTRALMSLRLGKGWGVWSLDCRPDFSVAESSMDAFINWNRGFVGKAAAMDERGSGPKCRLVTLVIDVDGIDVSSGGYANQVQRPVAMGYVAAENAASGTRLQVEILGERYDAETQGAPLYDANGAKMRG